eukprot:Skav211535  [mRNA]  locus=scaffold352:459942:460355:- [translate_table: standard]
MTRPIQDAFAHAGSHITHSSSGISSAHRLGLLRLAHQLGVNIKTPTSLQGDRYRGHRDHRLYLLRLNQESVNVMASQPLPTGSIIQVCVPVHHRNENIQDVDMEDHPDDPSTLDSSLPVPAASPGTPPEPPPATPPQ